MKTIRITTAIFLAIKELETTGFSIYELTKNIRERVNDGDYYLYEYGNDVQHDMVREHFLEFNNEGLLSHLDMTVRHGYRQYISNIPVTATPTPTMVPIPCSVIVQNAIASTNIPTDVQLKIYTYLKNSGVVSTKMIQSRLKGHNYTCEDIYKFLNDIKLMNTTFDNLPVSKRITVKI